MKRLHIRLMLACLLSMVSRPPAIVAAASSETAVPALVAALQARQLDAFAARDPQAADRFVAVLVFPKVQLLLVAGRHAQPDVIMRLLEMKDYREVYSALATGAIPEGKLFVQDMDADGLRTRSSQSPDVIYEQVTTQTILGGDPGARAYRDHLARLDPAYARSLQVLLDAVAASAPAVPAATVSAAPR